MEMRGAETTEIKWIWVCKSACVFHSVLLEASLFFQAYFQTVHSDSQGCNKLYTSASESLWSLSMTTEAVSMLCFLVELPRICCSLGLHHTAPVPLPQLWLPSHSFPQQLKQPLSQQHLSMSNNLSVPQTGCNLNPMMGNVTLRDKTPG